MSYQTVTEDQAAAVLRAGDALVLDVRTPGEFATLGHLPGARLLPVQCIASAPAVLPRDGRPILVYCEHGVRSRHAADVLVRAGFPNVLNLAGGMADWHGERAFDEPLVWGPSPWVLEHAALYQGRVLDVAAGRGRHALLFAAAGFEVTAIDRSPDACADLARNAAALGVHVDVRHADLEAEDFSFGEESWDVVVVTRYLHRPLFPALRDALSPGGVLVYETFTSAQGDEPTGPSSPAFLLHPGELPELVIPLEVVASHEGLVGGQHLAGIVARKAAATDASGSR